MIGSKKRDVARAGATCDAVSSPIEVALRGLLERNGITPPHQAKQISLILNISDKQVRRKFEKNSWTILELQAVTRHYGHGLSSLFRPDDRSLPLVEALWVMDGLKTACSIRVGRLMSGSGTLGRLACVRGADGTWLVGSAAALDQAGAPALRYGVELLEFFEKPTPLKIAVVDDDETSASVLADFFNEEGHLAQAYTSPRALPDQALKEFDAFVVDWILSDPSGQRETCHRFVEKIRALSPQAKVVLLTGKLRESAVIESELTQAMHSLGVTNLLEKPARPKLVLTTVLG